MDLFSMGVIIDDDRPKQHRPAPIRCYEDELLPPLPKRVGAVCSTCKTEKPIKGKPVCMSCERDAKSWSSKTRKAYVETRRLLKFRAKLIANGGAIEVPGSLLRTAREFVDAGNARWATPRDLNRFGLPADARVVIMLDRQTTAR